MSPLDNPHATKLPPEAQSTASILGSTAVDACVVPCATTTPSPTSSLAIRRRSSTDHLRKQPSPAAVTKMSPSLGCVAIAEEMLEPTAVQLPDVAVGGVAAGPSTRTEVSPELREI